MRSCFKTNVSLFKVNRRERCQSSTFFWQTFCSIFSIFVTDLHLCLADSAAAILSKSCVTKPRIFDSTVLLNSHAHQTLLNDNREQLFCEDFWASWSYTVPIRHWKWFQQMQQAIIELVSDLLKVLVQQISFQSGCGSIWKSKNILETIITI